MSESSTLKRLRDARRLRSEHEQAFRDQVRQAMADRGGHTVIEIAEAAGITRERAYQIAQGRR
jgi:hypothetical protein